MSVLVGLDREFDEHDTPRICGLVDLTENKLWLGSITATSLSIIPIEARAGQLAYITTYEYPLPSAEQIDHDLDAVDPNAVCSQMTRGSIFSQFENPVCAASWIGSASGHKTATLNSIH